MRHPNKKLLSAGAVMVGLSAFVPNPFMTGEALAQATITGVVNMTASISNPLSIAEVTKLKFGSFAVAAGGELTLKVVGGAQSITPATEGYALGGSNQVGQVQVKAPSGATFSLTIPTFSAANLTMKNTGSTDTLTVTKIKFKGAANLTDGGASASNTLSKTAPNHIATGLHITGGTSATFNYGGTLLFTAGQGTGTYTGSFTMVQTF